MTYIVLASVFFISVALAVLGFFATFLKRNRFKVFTFYILWFSIYGIFILFFTGPADLSIYPPRQTSPYKLPWQAGVSRWVSQGNRSFTSHRAFYEYSWDFWMPIGTEVLAAREGRVVEVEDRFDGIGFKANFVAIEHSDGTKAIYAHIRRAGSRVRVGELVSQGQPIAYSGLVGQTINPHLHFMVVNKKHTSSIPISFIEVPGGIPLAGRAYTSENKLH